VIAEQPLLFMPKWEAVASLYEARGTPFPREAVATVLWDSQSLIKGHYGQHRDPQELSAEADRLGRRLASMQAGSGPPSGAPSGTEHQVRSFGRDLAALFAEAREAAEASRAALRELAAAGWQWDPVTRKAKAPTGQARRQKPLDPQLVRSIYDLLIGPFARAWPDEAEPNPPRLREHISALLDPLWPAAERDPAEGGRLWVFIQGHANG